MVARGTPPGVPLFVIDVDRKIARSPRQKEPVKAERSMRTSVGEVIHGLSFLCRNKIQGSREFSLLEFADFLDL